MRQPKDVGEILSGRLLGGLGGDSDGLVGGSLLGGPLGDDGLVERDEGKRGQFGENEPTRANDRFESRER